jgi:hypothetical protein
MPLSSNYYLIQYQEHRQLPFIYSFVWDGLNTYVSIIQNANFTNSEPLLIGTLIKHNKRGYTIRVNILSSNSQNLFLSNSDFIRRTHSEYLDYLNKRN